MRKIQTSILPDDWLKKVEDFKIDEAPFGDSEKAIAKYIRCYIIKEKENSLWDPLVVGFIFHILYQQEFLKCYEFLPIGLIENGMSELKGTRGLEFSKKLHSVFIEFLTYKYFYGDGYSIKESKREQGSCDLVLEKNDETYNAEVKFKESEYIGISRLFDIISGLSLLSENEFVRGLWLEIELKVVNINNNKKEILAEINDFFTKKEDTFDGKYIKIFNSDKKNRQGRSVAACEKQFDSKLLCDDYCNLSSTKCAVCKLFIGEDRHITNLINKSRKFENFIGCLSWIIEFSYEIDFQIIEQAFNELLPSLNFDFHINISHIGHTDDKRCHFVLRKNNVST